MVDHRLATLKKRLGWILGISAPSILLVADQFSKELVVPAVGLGGAILFLRLHGLWRIRRRVESGGPVRQAIIAAGWQITLYLYAASLALLTKTSLPGVRWLFLPGLFALPAMVAWNEYKVFTLVEALNHEWTSFGDVSAGRELRPLPLHGMSAVASSVIVMCLVFLVGVGYRVGAPVYGWPTLGEIVSGIRDPQDAVVEESTPRPDNETPPPRLETGWPVPPVVPSGPPAAEATAACVLDVRTALEGVRNRVAAAMLAAYDLIGRTEIGCPQAPARREGRVFVLDLADGESEPSIVVGDRAGGASVVFEGVAARADRLIERRVLVSVLERQTTGFGDFQVMELVNGACTLSARAQYGDAYVHLPRTATALVVAEAVEREKFPVLVDVHKAGGRARYAVTFMGATAGNDEPEVVLVERSGAAHVLGEPRRMFEPTGCADVSSLEALAQRVYARWLGGN